MAYLSQPVRDLAWLIGSAPLMHPDALPQPPAGWVAAAQAEAQQWLEELDNNPRPLNAWLAGAARAHGRFFRLGRQAERLVAFWLAQRRGFSVVAAGREIIDGGRVLGELDVVFRDPARGLVHWETAVKFYLRGEASSAWEAYIGPNPRDRLAQKVGHVLGHQLPLARDPRVRAALGLTDEPLLSEAFVKGWLFYPADSDWRAPAFTPHGADPGHGRGWWLRWGAGAVPCSARSSRFVLLQRPDWLPPWHRPDDGAKRPLALSELTAALNRWFRDQHAAQLVAEVRRDGEGWWSEIARGFVVHAHWPEIVPREDDD